MTADRKIRVLQVIPSLQPGGAERMAVQLLLGLDRSRYSAAAVSLGRRTGADLEFLAANDGLTVWYLDKHPGFDARMYWRFDQVLRRFEPDVVHSHLNSLLYVAPLALARRTPVIVYTAHNFPELLVPSSLRWFYRTSFRCGVTPVSLTRSLTPVLCAAFHLGDLPLIRNGIPVSRFQNPKIPRTEWRVREGYSAQDVLFVCVARLSPQKNHALLLKAFAAGPFASSAAHLLVAGEGELRRSLTRLASELGITSRVHFLGNRRDIPELLAAGDVFALSSAQEANPLCIMEAMAAGLPVVSTAVGGVPELVESGVQGFLTEPGDVGGLARAMCVVLHDAELRAALGSQAAKRAIDQFDVSDMVRAYENLYAHRLRAQARLIREHEAEHQICQIQ
jgi:glycosyltransferase involved in cell wall biosynthesis